MNDLRHALVALCLSALVSAVDADAATDWRPDDLVTLRVQVGLFSAPEIDPASIAVVTKDGVVTMRGVVPTADVKARVEQMVRQTEGVKSLDSSLTVDPASAVATPNPRPPDRTLQADVTQKLTGEAELRDSEIQVQSVNGGVVVLSGYANSLDDQLRALRVAKGVTGVTFVQNQMKTPPGAGHDLDLPSGQARGADAQNRREKQALEGVAAETPPVVPGAPTPPSTPEGGPGAADVEGHIH